MIINTSNKKKLAKKAVILRSVASKSRGLMFRKKIVDEGYVFIFHELGLASFHMFFVFFPIDMLFLGENKEVLNIKRNVKPFTPRIKSEARYVIELPRGSTKDVSKGDIISFK
ncbi:DUF192 domain-containing protein [Nanoarchaeota archaeon]